MSKDGRHDTGGRGVVDEPMDARFIEPEDVRRFPALRAGPDEELSGCAEAGDCFGLLLDAALRVPGVDRGWIYVAGAGEGSGRVVACRGLGEGPASGVSPQASAWLERAMAGDLSGENAAESLMEGLCPPVILPVFNEGDVSMYLAVASHGGVDVPRSIVSVLEGMTSLARGAVKLILHRGEPEHRVSERTMMLHQSEARFRQLAEATFEGVAVTESGILLDGNPRMAEMHGYRLEEMIGRPVTDFVAPGSRDLVRHHISGGIEATYEYEGLHKDGSTFHAEVRASMRDWLGRSIRVTAIRDISGIKETAARLRSLQTEFRHAQRLGLVSEVSAGILHQIGQPLCSMGMNLSAALRRLRAPEPEIAEALPMLEDIERDLAMVRKTISRLRALADPGKPSRVRVDLNPMIGDVLGLVAEEAERRHVRIDAEPGDGMTTVHGDPVQLSQVVLILLNNSFDACEGLPAERRIVRVRTETCGDGGWVRVSVSDMGAGIRADVMDNLFAPFLTTKQNGLGMGLRLSQTIIHSHGGHIHGANRTDECGAEFTFSLPARVDESYP